MGDIQNKRMWAKSIQGNHKDRSERETDAKELTGSIHIVPKNAFKNFCTPGEVRNFKAGKYVGSPV
jgi:hypothetical protein